MNALRAFTIGFTKKSAREFFTKLVDAGVRRVLDVRLNNSSQLAGFAKREDLEFFLARLANIEYLHLPDLAPTQDILDQYKKENGDWAVYQQAFLQLMAQRQIEDLVSPEILDYGCLLCSEHMPEHCHRRLVIEYLADRWGPIETLHIT